MLSSFRDYPAPSVGVCKGSDTFTFEESMKQTRSGQHRKDTNWATFRDSRDLESWDTVPTYQDLKPKHQQRIFQRCCTLWSDQVQSLQCHCRMRGTLQLHISAHRQVLSLLSQGGLQKCHKERNPSKCWQLPLKMNFPKNLYNELKMVIGLAWCTESGTGFLTNELSSPPSYRVQNHNS